MHTTHSYLYPTLEAILLLFFVNKLKGLNLYKLKMYAGYWRKGHKKRGEEVHRYG